MMAAGKKLTPKQLAFIRAYKLNGGNGTDAARQAGYKGSDDTLAAMAHENLRKPQIQAEIAKIEKAAQEKFNITQEQILRELALLGFGTLADVLDWDDNGNVTLKAREKMSERGLAIIDSIKIKKGMALFKDEDGETVREPYVEEFHVKIAGKQTKKEALELLGQHLGLWKDGRGGSDQDSRRAVLARLQNYFQKNRRERSGGGE